MFQNEPEKVEDASTSASHLLLPLPGLSTLQHDAGGFRYVQYTLQKARRLVNNQSEHQGGPDFTAVRLPSVNDPFGPGSRSPYAERLPSIENFDITSSRKVKPSIFEPLLPQEGHHEYDVQGRATESTGTDDRVDYTTAADSGYHSGTRYSCTNPGKEDLIDNDTDSVVTDGWPSSLPKQDKYLLEAEFAREMFNRSSVRTRDRFGEREQKVMDLLYSFSVMIGGRASSAAERGAASFVRRGRRYV